MTTYPDLSPYSYLPDSIPPDVTIRTVGWLGAETDFSTAEPSTEFLNALTDLCLNHQTARTRGWHTCELHPAGETFPSPFCLTSGEATVMLGSAEVRVVAADGTVLAAPDLVLHYVRDHRYAPPAVFVDAVLAGRVAPEPQDQAGA